MAVPVNIAKRVVPPLIDDGEFNYPWLGVRIATVDADYARSDWNCQKGPEEP